MLLLTLITMLVGFGVFGMEEKDTPLDPVGLELAKMEEKGKMKDNFQELAKLCIDNGIYKPEGESSQAICAMHLKAVKKSRPEQYKQLEQRILNSSGKKRGKNSKRHHVEFDIDLPVDLQQEIKKSLMKSHLKREIKILQSDLQRAQQRVLDGERAVGFYVLNVDELRTENEKLKNGQEFARLKDENNRLRQEIAQHNKKKWWCC